MSAETDTRVEQVDLPGPDDRRPLGGYLYRGRHRDGNRTAPGGSEPGRHRREAPAPAREPAQWSRDDWR